jgi:predicted permease
MFNEVHYGMWSWKWAENLVQDFRYGARLLRKEPGFAATAVLALAIAIGANVALFSVVNAVLLRPLPYPGADELVMIWKLRFPGGGLGAPPSDFLAWRSQSQAFEGMAAFVRQTWNLSGRSEPTQVEGLGVTPDFFSVLGVEPARGRPFQPEAIGGGDPRTALISDRLWRNWLHRNSDVIGSGITLNGQPYTIGGVLPASFSFMDTTADVFIPMALNSASNSNSLSVLARLRSGATREQAEAELAVIATRLRAAAGDLSRMNPGVVPLATEVTGNIETLLLPLFGAVGCVLLIGCATLANLLMARASARRREMAVRSALGADRGRLIAQMLTESVLLALVGGLAGLLLTNWLLRLVVAAHPKGLPRIEELNIDSDVMLFALAVSVITGILCGLGLALRASRVSLEATLREAGSSLAGFRRQWLRGTLVVAEVALSFVLLVGAGLLVNSFARLVNVDPGFRSDHLLTMQITLPAYSYPDGRRVNAFYQQALNRVIGLPGIKSAGLANDLPLARGVGHVSFSFREGSKLGADRLPIGEDWDVRALYLVSPDYLSTMGTRLLSGRAFTDRDNREGAPPVVIVNRTFAEEFLPRQDPIGRRLHLGPWDVWCTIIGVSEDMKNGGLGDDQLWLSKPPFGTIYLPHAVLPQFAYNPPWDVGRTMHLVARTTAEPLGSANAVRREVWSVNPNQAVAEAKTMEDRVMDSVASRRLGMWPLVIFAAMALGLAGGGIYGLVAYAVAQRTREIGIRVALGASRTDVLRWAMRDSMILALVGLLLGGLAAHWLTRVLASQLYAITAADPTTYLAVVALLLAVVAVATYLPARSAASIDPMVALRSE